jgi:hypothetical protein
MLSGFSNFLKKICWVKPAFRWEIARADNTQLRDRFVAVSSSISALPIVYLFELSPNTQKQLETLLARSIGPIATLLLKRGIERSITCQQFLGRLNRYIRARSPLWGQIEELMQRGSPKFKTASQMTIVKANSTATAIIGDLNPECLATYMTALEKSIDPMAIFMVQKLIAQNPDISQIQLINALVQGIPDPKIAQEFLSCFFRQ